MTELFVAQEADVRHMAALVLELGDTYKPEGILIWLDAHREDIAAGRWLKLRDVARDLAGGMVAT